MSALLLPSSVGGAIANFGVTLAGRAAVNLNFTAGDRNCRAAIELCGIRTVLTSRKFIQKADLATWPEMIYLEDLLPRFTPGAKFRAMLTARFAPIRRIAAAHRPDDIAAILFSSGSTGIPKGIELTHWNILSNIEAAATVFPIHSGHCMLGVLPLFHSFGYTLRSLVPRRPAVPNRLSSQPHRRKNHRRAGRGAPPHILPIHPDLLPALHAQMHPRTIFFLEVRRRRR